MAAIKSAEHVVHKLHRCLQCGHRWTPRSSGVYELPVRCPGCNTRVWRKRQRVVLACGNCGNQWTARVAKPKACPKCFVRLAWD